MRRLLTALATFLLGFAVLPGSVSAHTDFESSSPADGETVPGPVGEVVISFTNPAEPVDDGFVALDGAGDVRLPSVETDDSRTFVLRFEPPLTPGQNAIRWQVRAGDAHPIEGAFSFTATAPPTPPPTTVPATAAPAEAAAETTTAPTSTAPETTLADVDAASAEERLEEFLAVDSDTPGSGTQRAGWLLAFLGGLLAVGAIAFLATAFRGTGSEVGRGVMIIRAVGIVIALGGAIELVGLLRADSAWADGAFDSPGLAATLRLAAGVLIALGLRAFTVPNAPRALSADVLASDETGQSTRDTTSHSTWASIRWTPAGSHLALLGCVAFVLSPAFDGHTLSEGPRLVHSLVSVVHVAAAAAWFGGLGALCWVAWRRHRGGQESDASSLVVRFSSVAALALVGVLAAGALLAVFVLDEPGDLTGTEWGRLLLVKSGLVAIAIALGAYNHLRLRPRLVQTPDDPELAAHLRSTVAAEVVLLACAVLVSGWLVTAAV